MLTKFSRSIGNDGSIICRGNEILLQSVFKMPVLKGMNDSCNSITPFSVSFSATEIPEMEIFLCL